MAGNPCAAAESDAETVSEQLVSHLPSLRFLDLQLEQDGENGVELGLDGLHFGSDNDPGDGEPRVTPADSDSDLGSAMDLDPIAGGGDGSSSSGTASLHLENLIRRLESVERGCFRDARAASQASMQASQDRWVRHSSCMEWYILQHP